MRTCWGLLAACLCCGTANAADAVAELSAHLGKTPVGGVDVSDVADDVLHTPILLGQGNPGQRMDRQILRPPRRRAEPTSVRHL